jgi:TRAP-type mannitol/chloroaromatic compound transport system permease small subunit
MTGKGGAQMLRPIRLGADRTFGASGQIGSDELSHMDRFLFFIDSLSAWVGKAFAWLILVLTLGVSYEVFVRYVLRAPTTWAFDFSYITYGAMFLMAGAYTLSRNGHVRGDVVYRLWKPRTQATMDLVLYILFFLPAVLALIYAGWNYAQMSIRFREVSIFSPAGVPVFPLKTLVPISGVLLLLQGIAEIIRCILCIRTGVWPQRLHDVEETESLILQEQRIHAAEQGEQPQAGR